MASALRDAPLGERARGRWRELLPQFGVDSRLLTGKHVPCPICGGKDRFRFDDKDGRGTWICNQCRAGDGIALVQRLKGWDFRQVAEELEKFIGTVPALPRRETAQPEADQAAKYAQARDFWRAGAPIASEDPVDRYLRYRVGTYQPTRALRTIAATSWQRPSMRCNLWCGRGWSLVTRLWV